MEPIRGITESQYKATASLLKCKVSAIKAVDFVESAGNGFLKNGKLKILFEGHKFFIHTQGKYSITNPDLCYKKYTNKFYGLNQWDRYLEATKLDAVAAALSCSWGRFQIMGDEYKRCGYVSVIEMIKDFETSESRHLIAVAKFIISKNIDDDLRELNWSTFCYYYNGPKYAENGYDIKLKKAFKQFEQS